MKVVFEPVVDYPEIFHVFCVSRQENGGESLSPIAVD